MYEAYEDDPEFQRPNHLALISLITGVVTLMGQALVVCVWYCAPFLMAVPVVITLFTGILGYQQAKRTGQGREMSIVGLVLGFINLFIGLLWLALTFAYVLLAVVIIATQ